MALYHFHRFLISFAILFDFGFTLWSYRQWQNDGQMVNLVMAIASSVVSVGLIAYLVYFNRTLSVLQQRIEAPSSATQ